jgi:DNA-binding SARP family transcriptional activator
MSVLHITLMGQMEVVHAGLPSTSKVTRVGQGLLAYLLLYRHRCHPREVLAGLFWGEYSQRRARGCLNTALWRLRQVLETEGIPRGTYLQTTATGEVGFNSDSDYWLDVAAFEEQSSQVLAKSAEAMDRSDAETLENALQLYSGELLEGFYDDWALRERERLRRLYLNSLAHLLHCYKYHGAFEKSLACGQQILDEDPLREEIHREMMRLYLENGQRALAVRQYGTCCEVLSAELGIPPMEETQALYAQIAPVADPRRARSIPAGEPTLRRLQLAVLGLDEAWAELQRAVLLIEQLLDR